MAGNLRTTERSLRVIEKLRSENGARISVLDDDLEMSRSTIHNHLQVLIEHGFVVKEGEIYHLGLRFLDLGEYVQARKYGYRLAKTAVYELSEEINEECEFLAENNGQGIIVHESHHPENKFEGTNSRTYKDSTVVGTYFHLHNHAAGKAILAELTNDEIETIVDKWGLPANTDHTITTTDELWDELEKIREQGLAFSDEEFTEGLREVARRVENPNGDCIGALAVIAPRYRMSDSRFKHEVPEKLREQVDSLEAQIEAGYLDDFR
ncbi:IclR family transcriptional regulator [Halobium palmae]|uniref:IclR family transcriptional regulator n=1 Tax=Halobium palmae TaxID=1776492 RepID=A0ABD5RUN1_9EURY